MKAKKLKEIIGMMSMVVKTSPVPILEDILLEPGRMVVSDLYSTLIIDFDHKVTSMIPFGRFKKLVMALDPSDEVTFAENREKEHVYVKINGVTEVKYAFENIKDFPVIPTEKDCCTHGGRLDKDLIAKMHEALFFISNDELRPSMCCVAIDENIAATNGHWLYFEKVKNAIPPMKIRMTEYSEKEIKEPFMFKKMTIEVLAKSKMEFEFDAFTENGYPVNETTGLPETDFSKGNMRFKAEGMIFWQRCVDERFPDYINVIPDFSTSDHLEVIVDNTVLQKTLKLAIVQANTTTKQVKFAPILSENSMWISSEDLDFKTEYKKKVPVKIEVLLNGEVAKPVKVVAENEGLPEEHPAPYDGYDAIGFNGALLLGILSKTKTPFVSIESSQPNRAAIINKKYLLMPVMLNEYI